MGANSRSRLTCSVSWFWLFWRSGPWALPLDRLDRHGFCWTVSLSTRPFLKRIRRSAMGASAELCVMMMTVMPACGRYPATAAKSAYRFCSRVHPWARRTGAAWDSWPVRVQWTRAAARRPKAAPESWRGARRANGEASVRHPSESGGRSAPQARHFRAPSGWGPDCRTGRQSRRRHGGIPRAAPRWRSFTSRRPPSRCRRLPYPCRQGC